MKRSLSLNTKIVIFTSVMILLTTSLIAGVVLFSSKKYFLQRSIEFLDQETSIIAQDVQLSFDELAQNLTILSQAPPIKNIITSHKRNDHSILKRSKNHLSSIFTSLLKVHDSYTALRFISATADGKELVRVNRNGDKVLRVSESELKNKTIVPYFKEGIKLTKGKVLFSAPTITLPGKKHPAITPELHSLIPVYDKNRQLFGLLILNINYKAYIKKTLSKTFSNKHLLLYNNNNDYFEYNPDTKSLEFIKHYKKTSHLHDEDNNLPGKLLKLSDNKNKIFISKPIYSDKTKKKILLTLLVSIDKDKLFQPDKQIIFSIFKLLMLISIASIIITIFFSKWLMRHLKEMTSAINEIEPKDGHGNLPVQLNDEVGLLARAFVSKTERLRTMALYDSLTGLANRSYFLNHLHSVILNNNLENNLIAIFFIDLNRFKEINDQYGHDYGDALLIAFSRKMQNISRQNDFIGRLGGDEFGIIIENLSSFEDIKALENRFTPLLKNTFDIKGIELHLTVSIGVAIYPLHGKSVDELMRAADIAMYEAKKNHAGSWVLSRQEKKR